MTVLVDTSVWSLALRRDIPSESAVAALTAALTSDLVVTTGLIIQELLQGVVHETTRPRIMNRFDALTTLQPGREDHVAAADLRNSCRRAGVQLGTIDALLAQLCINNGLVLLTADRDFDHAAQHCELQVTVINTE